MSSPRASFYFDLASPHCYLAAERILLVLPAAAAWQPVLADGLAGGQSGPAFRCQTEEEVFRDEVARRARQLGLLPLRWPKPFPFDSTLAMRVATYAKSIGRVVPFAQAAFRQAFAGGRDLEHMDNVLIAAAACEMHPTAVIAAAELRTVARELQLSTRRAAQAGVVSVPAVSVGGRVFLGEHAVEEAAPQANAHASRSQSAEPATSRGPASGPQGEPRTGASTRRR